MAAPLGIAIPALPTSAIQQTAAGSTDVLGRQLADIIRNDLGNSGLFKPLGADRTRAISFNEVTAPGFGEWSAAGASSLVQGYIKANGDGTLTVGCYLYDVAAQSELARQGFVVPAVRLAPRRPQMRRCDLSAADRRRPLFRQPRGLCLRNRAQGAPRQAARDHGSGRRQFALPDQRPDHRADPAVQPEPAVDRVHELRQRSPRDLRAEPRVRPAAPGRPRREPELRAALFARRPLDPVLDGAQRQHRPLPRVRIAAARPSA